MIRVGIVILNFLNYNDTIECVNSLLGDKYTNKRIIIVDNGSTNESYTILSEQYMNIKNLFVIKSNSNLGFARGNNLGIKYAREKLLCDAVLLVNNDTLFKDKSLVSNLVEAFDSGIGVIGPRIISADWKQQNPVQNVVSKERVKYQINQNMECTSIEVAKDNILKAKLKKINWLVLYVHRTKNVFRCLKKYYHKEHCSNDLVLHGSCMMLTDEYFKYYNGLFNKTFLYYEENIITLITNKVNLKKKYIPNCFIYHKEDQSSLMSFNNSNSIKDKYELDSMNECLKLFDLSYEQIKRNTN